MDLRILFVDDQDIRNDLFEYFNNSEVSDNILKAEVAESFAIGIEKIKKNDYDIVVLDLCLGEPSEDATKEGLVVLKEIQSRSFVPVIFFTGIAHSIQDLKSEVVGVIGKSDGIELLKAEIERIVSSNVALLKGKIINHIHEELKNYFWDIIDNQKNIFKFNESDYSLGYLMLRRLSKSLSKDNIKAILGDTKIKEGKTHPMEFYIYPPLNDEYETGEILTKDGETYIILTPSCDFVEDRVTKRNRSVGLVLLGYARPLECTSEFKEYKISNSKKNLESLTKLIASRKGDRYFFLPGTPFINNYVVDFQFKTMVPYEHLSGFTKIAKLDEPFAQSMSASFIRYYSRIGSPDIDTEYVISKL